MKQTEATKKSIPVRRLSLCGLFAALALILSYVEVLLPLPGALSGFKLGLANGAVLLALYWLGTVPALLINLVRILLAALLFGTPVSMLYALSGGALSFLVMAGLKATGRFSCAGVSMAGGVVHNLGQIAVAAWVLKTPGVWTLFPLLGLAGLFFGALVGILAALLDKRLRPMLKRYTSLLLVVVLLVGFSGCVQQEDPRQVCVTNTFLSMDTPITYTLYGETEEQARGYGELVQETFVRISSAADRYDPEAAIYHDWKNQDLCDMRALEETWHQRINGALNLYMGAAIDYWNGLASAEDRTAYLQQRTDLPQLLEQQVLDLGAIAKGYAAEQAAKAIKEAGCTSGLIDAGGNVVTIGTKPDGSLWRIGIADPENPNQTMTVVSVGETSLVTSGDYQRYTEYNGVRFCHILDPVTGYPIGVNPETLEQTSMFHGVTVRCSSSALGDILSTALFVLGPGQAESLAEELSAEGTAEVFFIYSDLQTAQTAGW